MPWNLLLFPIMGGYWLLIRFKPLKYYHQRVERQKLLFNAIIAGAFLLVLSFSFTAIFPLYFPRVANAIAGLSPAGLPFFWTTLGSFVLGIFISEFFNLFIKSEKEIIKSIKSIGNELELLLEASWNKAHLVQITLTNGKVYVGWVKSLPIPNHSSYICILPALSGYRKSEDKELVFTTQYLDVYAGYVREGLTTDIKALAHLVIKVDQILTANRFDIEMYERFNELKEDTPDELSDAEPGDY